MKNIEKYCCEDVSKIENYELALKDDFKSWDCHHRLETHTSDGEERKVYLTKDELIALKMYYSRPASELIFMRTKDHLGMHTRYKNANRKYTSLSQETKEKLSKALKGRKQPPRSEEYRRKLGLAHKGKAPWNKGLKLKKSSS